MQRRDVLFLHGHPAAVAGAAERTLAWLSDAFERAGDACRWLMTDDAAAIDDAVEEADVVVVGELRPGDDLAVAARLLGVSAELVVINHGYGFCAIESRACGRCPVRRICRDSDRVDIYRQLAQRAACIVYLSPLHRRASEEFIGSYPGKTLVFAPPHPCEALFEATVEAAVAVHDITDDIEWLQLVAYAHTSGADQIDVVGAPRPGAAAAPRTVRVHDRPTTRQGETELVSAARSLVCLPGRPVPFGGYAAAFVRSGRPVVINQQVGLASFSPPLTAAAALDRARDRTRDTLFDAIGGHLGGGRPPAGSARAAPRGSAVCSRPLLFCHHLGLGDSIATLPLARALHRLSGGRLTWAMPAHHLSLLEPELDAALCSVEELDLAGTRADWDLVVEISITLPNEGQGFLSDDILGERWVRFDLARQASATGATHENLVSLLGRCGIPSVPGRPRIAPSQVERERALSTLAAAGLDPLRELVVSMHPGSRRHYKRWPSVRFAALARRIRRTLGARVVVIGGIGEDSLIDELVGRFSDADLVLRETPLRDLAAILAACSLHVGNDSGLTHLAAACETPVLALFGCTDPRRWAPTHPWTYVVRAENPAGRPSKSMADLSVDAAAAGMRNLLLRVVGDPPASDAHIVTALPVEATDSELRTFCSTLTFSEPDGAERARKLHDAAATPISWGELCRAVSAELAEFAVASGLVGRPWMLRASALETLASPDALPRSAQEGPRCAYVIEAGYQHLFPVMAMLRELEAPVITTGWSASRRFDATTEVVWVREREIAQELDVRDIDVVISTSHRIPPSRLRGSRGRPVVFIGHGESDKVYGQRRDARPSFVNHPINDEFDLLAVASQHHMQRYRNPNRRLTGYLKHDLFVHGDYGRRAPHADWILWAPTWGRHSSVPTWLDAVVAATARCGLRCILHLHPHSEEVEPEIMQRARVEVLRHPHFRLAHCGNILDAMAECSLMLGDVSTTCYDWLLFERPIVFLDHPGLCFDEEKRLFSAGAVVSPGQDLEAALRDALRNPSAKASARADALRRHFPLLDGNAAKRVHDAITTLWRERWSTASGGGRKPSDAD